MRSRSSLGVIGLVVAGVVLGAGCNTYSADLDRAKRHYESNQFEKALALFRVLEPDQDSFSDAERAQYCYFRGMNAYRLSNTTVKGTGVADPKKGFRDNARHWLALSAAIEKVTPDSLSTEQRERLKTTLTELNRDVFGGEAVDEKKAEGEDGEKTDGEKTDGEPVEKEK